MAIVDTVMNLEITPPELVGDISSNGIVPTGGGSFERVDKLIQRETGIECSVAKQAVSCVVIGTGKALENIDALQEDYTINRK